MKNPYRISLIIGILDTLFTVTCGIIVCVFSEIVWCKVACLILAVICASILGNNWCMYSIIEQHIQRLTALRELHKIFNGEADEKENSEK